MAQVKEKILELERRFWEDAGDPKFFKEAMADDVIVVMEPMGFIDKESAVKMSDNVDGWKDVKMQDVHVIELTPDCIAIAYHGEGSSLESGEPQRSSICSVYVQRDGNWQMGLTSHQPWKPEQACGSKAQG